jgi:formylglycine-generating enzyme required for sulfatase activity
MAVVLSVAICFTVIAEQAARDTYTETITSLDGEEIAFDMVLIPGGTFNMGSPPEEPGRNSDEGPQHVVQVDPFFLCTTETSLDLFMAYYYETYTGRKQVTANDIDAMTGPTPVYGELSMGYAGTWPAFAMTCDNAVNFCKWLSEKTGKEYRLPTEAEWEYAARAGTSTAYYFGDDPVSLGEYAWFTENSDFEPHEVASKKPNPWGLYDMLGNVQEWVQDLYSPGGYGTAADGKIHVARGGYYDSTPAEMRCAARGFEEPWWRMNDPQLPKSKWWLPQMNHIGFRIARSADAEPQPTALAFAPDGEGGYIFDTGILRGRIHADGTSFGLSQLTHIPSGAHLDRGAGILSYYRIFSADKRYGNAAFEWPSKAAVLPDGALQITWPSSAERPFEMTATYRWHNAATLDVETAVTAVETLEDFEVFLASYFDPAFASPYMYVKADDTDRFLLAEQTRGDWQMFPRDDAAAKLIRDGRWKIEPNPVDWAETVHMAAPLCFRRRNTGDVTVALMAPPGDCFATSTPYEGEGHFSLYLSLIGRDIPAGTTEEARSRFTVTAEAPDQQILTLYEAYMKEIGN